MAKTTFNEMEENTSAKGDEESVALIEQPADSKAEVAITNDQLAADGLVGEWTREDLNFPRINIVSKTGDLLDEGFELGSLILNKEITLAKKDEALRVVVINCIKRYQEDVTWGSGDQARVFDTQAEMREAGYSTEYGSPNYCQPLAHITFLIPASAVLKGDIDQGDAIADGKGGTEMEDAFPFEFNGDLWTMAQFTAAKTAFKTVGKPIASYLAFAGGKKLHGTWWELTSKLKTYGDNSWFSPFLVRKDKLDEETLAFVESVM